MVGRKATVDAKRDARREIRALEAKRDSLQIKKEQAQNDLRAINAKLKVARGKR